LHKNSEFPWAPFESGAKKLRKNTANEITFALCSDSFQERPEPSRPNEETLSAETVARHESRRLCCNPQTQVVAVFVHDLCTDCGQVGATLRNYTQVILLISKALVDSAEVAGTAE
jgi:hypothetical protein